MKPRDMKLGIFRRLIKACCEGGAVDDGRALNCASWYQKVMLLELRGASGQHVGVHSRSGFGM